MLKVLVITSLFPYPWHPARGVFNLQQFRHLSESCELNLIVLVPWLEFLRHKYDKTFNPGINAKIEFVGYFYLPKTGRVLYPVLMLPSLLIRYFQFKRYKPDCLLLSWAYPDAVAGMVLSRLLKIPAVIKIHGSDINTYANYKLRAAQIVWAVNKANAVVCVSQNLAEKLMQLGVPENKIRVIYNGVDKNLFFPSEKIAARKATGLPENRKILSYIGNLKREKGCGDLLEAFKKITDQDTEIDLYYIGSGPYSGRLQDQVKNFGLSERVKFTGSIAHVALPQWINASDSVVLPSHNEGVPNVLLEAMSCGIPVVATNVGGVPEIVNSFSGILVEAEDIEALTRAIRKVLEEKWDRQRISANMERFSWESNALQMKQLLQSIS